MRTLLALLVVASASLSAQSSAFTRGQQARVASTFGGGLTVPLPVVIVAVPGDNISARGKRLFVNDKAVTGFSAAFIGRVAMSKIPAQVAEHHSFVMGEQHTNQGLSEYWGLHPAASLQPEVQ